MKNYNRQTIFTFKKILYFCNEDFDMCLAKVQQTD
jgi:hypothetical protein